MEKKPSLVAVTNVTSPHIRLSALDALCEQVSVLEPSLSPQSRAASVILHFTQTDAEVTPLSPGVGISIHSLALKPSFIRRLLNLRAPIHDLLQEAARRQRAAPGEAGEPLIGVRHAVCHQDFLPYVAHSQVVVMLDENRSSYHRKLSLKGLRLTHLRLDKLFSDPKPRRAKGWSHAKKGG